MKSTKFNLATRLFKDANSYTNINDNVFLRKNLIHFEE